MPAKSRAAQLSQICLCRPSVLSKYKSKTSLKRSLCLLNVDILGAINGISYARTQAFLPQFSGSPRVQAGSAVGKRGAHKSHIFLSLGTSWIERI
jgi:hypothetical protein